MAEPLTPAGGERQGPDIDEIIAGYTSGTDSGLPDVFSGLPSRIDNMIADFHTLPPDNRGFLGLHLATAEDGHFLRHPDGTPVNIRDVPAAAHRPKSPSRNPNDI